MDVLFVRHIDIEGPGNLEPCVREAGLTPKVIALDEGESLPSDLTGIAAVVVLGGPMNVYEEDKYPFLKEEDRFLKELLRKDIPLLGICLGSQLIAKACGARVGKSPAREVGWYPAELTPVGKKDPLFAGVDEKLTVFHWHEDMFELPDGAELVVTASEGCPNQGFRMGRRAYAFQFHIEVTSAMIEDWGRTYIKKPEDEKEKETRSMARDHNDLKEDFDRRGRVIFGNFLSLAAK